MLFLSTKSGYSGVHLHGNFYRFCLMMMMKEVATNQENPDQTQKLFHIKLSNLRGWTNPHMTKNK